MGPTLPSVENYCTKAMQYIYYEMMDMYHCSASKSINLNASVTTVSENCIYGHLHSSLAVLNTVHGKSLICLFRGPPLASKVVASLPMVPVKSNV